MADCPNCENSRGRCWVLPIVYPISQMWRFDYEHNYIKVAQLRPPVTKIVIGSINWARVIELCLLFIILPIQNCIPMTRNALSIEAMGRRANNVLLPHTINWSNKVGPRTAWSNADTPSNLEQYRMGCWPGLITDRYLPQRLNSHQRHMPRGTLNSSARVAMARWIQWVTSSWNIGTECSPIVIICRWFRLSHNRPRWWVLPMYRSSSSSRHSTDTVSEFHAEVP